MVKIKRIQRKDVGFKPIVLEMTIETKKELDRAVKFLTNVGCGQIQVLYHLWDFLKYGEEI